MKKLIILSAFAISIFANDTFLNMKSCESVKLSKYTSLVSCHKVDYLIEYRFVDEEEQDNIKKITVITPTDSRIIKKIGK